MKLSLIILILSFSILFLFSCRRDIRGLSFELPKEEEFYVFPFQTHVDTKGLSCGNKPMEHQSDKVKRHIKNSEKKAMQLSKERSCRTFPLQVIQAKNLKTIVAKV